MYDPLSAAVDELRLHRAVFRRFSVRGAWGLGYGPGQRGIHVMERGNAILRADGVTTRIEAGDLVIVIRSIEHQLLSSNDGVRVRSASSLFEEQPGRGPITLDATRRGADASAEIACGSFDFDAKDHPMLALLPAVIHLSPAGARNAPRIAQYVQAILAELSDLNQGGSAIVTRLSEVLLIEALRAQAAVAPECPSGGWFRGLGDPALGRALSSFHANVAAPWTVESLAREAGQSRSAFAARFAEIMLETPSAFVTRWRMFHVRRRLRAGRESLDEIAKLTGYGSAAAMSVAFAREHHEAPGAYRRRQAAFVSAPEIPDSSPGGAINTSRRRPAQPRKRRASRRTNEQR